MTKVTLPTIGAQITRKTDDVKFTVFGITDDYKIQAINPIHGPNTFSMDEIEIAKKVAKSNKRTVKVPMTVENNPMIQGLLSKLPSNLSKRQKIALSSMDNDKKLSYIGSFKGFKTTDLNNDLKVTGGIVDEQTIVRSETKTHEEKIKLVNTLKPKELLQFKKKFEFEENSIKSNILVRLELDEIKNYLLEINEEIPF